MSGSILSIAVRDTEASLCRISWRVGSRTVERWLTGGFAQCAKPPGWAGIRYVRGRRLG